MTACNRDDREGRCDADDGLPCGECQATFAAEAAYWRGEWKVAPLSEWDPAKYRAEMRDAGRGHLVKP